jgi:hypothetical protein
MEKELPRGWPGKLLPPGKPDFSEGKKVEQDSEELWRQGFYLIINRKESSWMNWV